MIYYKIIVAPGVKKELIQKLKHAGAWVRENSENLYIGTGNSESHWVITTMKDYNASATAIDKSQVQDLFKREGMPLKEEYLSTCGCKFYDKMLYAGHRAGCIKCADLENRHLKSRIRKPRQPVIITKVLPGMPLSITSLIEALTKERDTLLTMASDLDTILGAIRTYSNMESLREEAIINYEKSKESIKQVLGSLK
jgi:hypothetical protein